MAEPDEMLLGCGLEWFKEPCIGLGVQIATCEGHVQHGYIVGASWDVLDGVHFGAIWRISLKHLCASAMQP